MAAQIRTPIERLDTAINKILTDYADEVAQNVDEVTVKVAQAGATALRASSRQTFGGTGRYAKGWTTTVQRDRAGVTAVIHNAETPGLPHLLEHGHANRDGGRTPGRAHIAPVEDAVVNAFQEEVASKL